MRSWSPVSVIFLVVAVAAACGPERRTARGRSRAVSSEGEGEGPAEGEGEGEGPAEGEGEGEGPAEGEGEGPAEGEGEGPAEGEGEGEGEFLRVDPDCVDGQYEEELPNPDADIDDLLDSYNRNDPEGFIIDVLARRYPTGAYLVEGGLDADRFGDCIDIFLSDRRSGESVIGELSTIVHECGHFFDSDPAHGQVDRYFITDDLDFSCTDGDSTERFGSTFARSRINNDDYSELRPPCGDAMGQGCDFYADTYLDGDPDDRSFEGGDQGFNMLLEEAVQYVNSLATGYAFNEHHRFSSSERDGILTFLWYVGRYLRYARTEYPDAHAFLLGDSCWREVILTVWGRGWMYLDATERFPALGIDDETLEELAADPMLVGEIQRVRDAHGCP